MAAPGAAAAVSGVEKAKTPYAWNGDKNKWVEWSTKVRSYSRRIDARLKEAMKAVESRDEPILISALGTGEEKELNARLYQLLTEITEGDAFTTVTNTEEDNGLEVWRQYARDSRPKTVGHQRGRMMALINPAFPDSCDTYSRRKKAGTRC